MGKIPNYGGQILDSIGTGLVLVFFPVILIWCIGQVIVFAVKCIVNFLSIVVSGTCMVSNAIEKTQIQKTDQKSQQQIPQIIFNEKVEMENNSKTGNAQLDTEVVIPNVLWGAFDQNVITAEDTYTGKTVAIKGIIYSIKIKGLLRHDDDEGYIEVWLNSGDRYGADYIICEFSKDSRGEISKLKKNQQVIINGICDGWDGNAVFIKDSKLSSV